MVEADIEDFLIIQDILASYRYTSSRAGISAGHYGNDSLEAYIY